MSTPVQPPPPASSYQNHVQQPPGVMPQRLATWVALGLGAFVILIVLFTALNSSTDAKTASRTSSNTTEQRAAAEARTRQQINDYQRQLDLQMRELERKKQEAERARAVSENAGYQGGGSGSARGTVGIQQPQKQEPDQIAQERRQREYNSLFASNIAFSYRGQNAQHSQPATALPQATRAPAAAPQEGPRAAPPPAAAAQDGYRIFEGTIIETVLLNRLNGSFAGPIKCLVTTNVYSHDLQHVLIPSGSYVLGETARISGLDQNRLACSFHRVLMPDGYSASLDQFTGLNQIGETGLRDKVNNHWISTFGMSLAIGAIAGFAEAESFGGYTIEAIDLYRTGVARSLSQSALQILQRYTNRLPEITIREGHRVKIWIAQDLTLPAYEEHHMKGNL